jgi:hypothetical protein
VRFDGAAGFAEREERQREIAQADRLPEAIPALMVKGQGTLVVLDCPAIVPEGIVVAAQVA